MGNLVVQLINAGGDKCERAYSLRSWRQQRDTFEGPETAQTISARQKLMFTLKIICFLQSICIIMWISCGDIRWVVTARHRRRGLFNLLAAQWSQQKHFGWLVAGDERGLWLKHEYIWSRWHMSTNWRRIKKHVCSGSLDTVDLFAADRMATSYGARLL